METTTEHSTTVSAIPRDFKIVNPLPPVVPIYCPQPDDFSESGFIRAFQMVNCTIPELDLQNPATLPEFTDSITELFNSEEKDRFMVETIVRSLILTIHKYYLTQIVQSSLTRLSSLHHVVYLLLQVFRENHIPEATIDFCEMLLADIADIFSCHVYEVVDQKFWAKTKTADDVISQFLSKEVAKLRLLNEYTYTVLSQNSVRKAIENGPASAAHKIMQWAAENNII